MDSLSAQGSTFLESAHTRREIFQFSLGIFLLAVLLRIGVVTLHPWHHIGYAEPVRIAFSLVQQHTYADAYGTNIGPTAHCAPLHPLLIAAIIWLFGSGFLGAFLLSFLASACVAAGYALLPVLSKRVGLGLWPGVFAGIAGAMLPINFWAQTSGIFDAPFTLLALVLLCYLLAGIWTRESFAFSEAALLGVASGLGCLLSPALTQILAAWSILAILRFRNRTVARFLVAAWLLLFVVLTPWAIRNRVALGKFIWTRSNFGLELQVSNNDFASPNLEKNVRTPELKRMHPFPDQFERERVRALGEIPYMALKKQEAFQWIALHPGRFARLTAQRIWLFWFPTMERAWQSAVEAIIFLLTLFGAISLARKRHVALSVIVPVLGAFPAVYYLIQVSPRYRLPIEPILFLLASRFLCDFLARVTQQQSSLKHSTASAR